MTATLHALGCGRAAGAYYTDDPNREARPKSRDNYYTRDGGGTWWTTGRNRPSPQPRERLSECRHGDVVMLAFAMMAIIRHRANITSPPKKMMLRLRTRHRS
jgi:hypothetical protein